MDLNLLIVGAAGSCQLEILRRGGAYCQRFDRDDHDLGSTLYPDLGAKCVIEQQVACPLNIE